MPIQCMTHEKCEWPDCSCSDATKKGRWNTDKMHSEGDYERADPVKMQAVLNEHFGPALTTAPQPSQGAGPTTEGARAVYVADLLDTFEQLRQILGTPEQDADALIATVRRLAAFDSPQEAGKVGKSGKMPNRVIPIQAIDVVNEEAPKFDADVLAIMLREAGATVDPDGCFYIERPAIRKLAEALNNL